MVTGPPVAPRTSNLFSSGAVTRRALKILTRYIVREHIGPLVFAASTLTTLLLLNQVAKQFGKLVGKGLSWGVIGEFFYLSLPFIVAMTLPMAVLVAVLYAFSRMAAENEVTALRASGVSLMRLVRPVLVMGAVLAVVMLLFNDQVLSRSNHRLRTLQTDIARKKPTLVLREQVINEVIPGKVFLKPGHIDPATNRLREVFIYNFEDPTRRKTIYADSGQMGLTPDQSTLQMLLHHGYVLQLARNDPGTLQRLYFTTDLVRLRGVANQFEKTENDDFKTEREMTVCEMEAEFQDGRSQFDAARQDLERLLGEAARYAATGVRPEPLERARPVPRKQVTTAGGLYCHFITNVIAAVSRGLGRGGGDAGGTLGVKSAEAAEPRASRSPASTGAQQPRGTAAPPPDTAREATPPLVRRTEARAPRVPVASVGQLQVINSRITDARTMMNRYEVEIQKKFALAAACVVFVIFGAPIALRFPRGGVGLVIGASLVAFALYYVCLIAGETLSDKLLLDPFLAMWLANVIFAAAGVVLLIRVQRTGPTARGGGAAEMWETARARLARIAGRIGRPVGRRRGSPA